ncbi:MAG: hypothetical protein JXX28_06660 [Deltaproteobacteria bacterium]|nr:hypothetical protein [Deltaproteobacteria bacterium]
MRILSLLPALLLTACGPKEAAPVAPAEAAPPPITVEMPDTSEARAFADNLVHTAIRDWAPIQGSEVRLTYSSMNFDLDGTWRANGLMKASFEEFDCQESGSWHIGEATTERNATVAWEIGRTTCPTREVGTTQRVELTIAKNGDVAVQFR